MDLLQGPAFARAPSRLFVEVTTRCNLRCRMCVKQSPGADPREGDMLPETFSALEPAFAGLEALVLNGVGEPLLHPDIVEFIARARERMPAAAWIGFQTNGRLLDAPLALELARAGLDRVCVSIDAVSEDMFARCREGEKITQVEGALAALQEARQKTPASRLEVAAEFVLMRDNLAELPATLSWAASKGVTSAIVSHILPYGAGMAAQALYGPNTDASRQFHKDWTAKARAQGIDMESYFSLLWKYEKTDRELAVIRCVREMSDAAAAQGIPLRLRNLLHGAGPGRGEVEAVFARAEEVAQQSGIRLHLPASGPRFARRCEAVENGGAFVTWDGQVSPCYALWRKYSCHFHGRTKPVTPKFFGDLARTDILAIWNSQPYAEFRSTVVRDAYPYCTNCNVYPCSDIDNPDHGFDCYGEEVPCGDCLWCLGLLQCLGQEHSGAHHQHGG